MIRGRIDPEGTSICASQLSMRALLLEFFPLMTGNRLVFQAMSRVMTEWIDTRLSWCQASVVAHGFFWMRFTHPADVAVTGHSRWSPDR